MRQQKPRCPARMLPTGLQWVLTPLIFGPYPSDLGSMPVFHAMIGRFRTFLTRSLAKQPEATVPVLGGTVRLESILREAQLAMKFEELNADMTTQMDIERRRRRHHTTQQILDSSGQRKGLSW